MAEDLDAISELLEDFKTELRRENKSHGTIDTYPRDIGYFVRFLKDQDPPIEPTAAALTRDNLGNYIDHTLHRLGSRTGRPVTPEYANRQYFSSSAGISRLKASSLSIRSTR
jgi:hypothetical protein